MPQNSTQTSTTNLPSWIEQPTQNAIGQVQSWMGSPANYVYGSKPGESLWAPLANGQKKAINNINWLSDQNLAKMFGIDTAGDLYKDFASFTPDKVTDEGGYLGKIDNYMNPYLDRVMAPQLKQIQDSLQSGRRDLGGSAAMSGAFGDARHGVMETGMYDDANRASTDVVGRTMSDAFTTAMGLRAGDNQNRINANQNKATAAAGIAGLGQQHFQNISDTNDALFNSGQVERGVEQERITAMRGFQEAIKNKKYDDAIKLLGVLMGSPQPSTTTTSGSQSSNDGIFGLLGALAGAFV